MTTIKQYVDRVFSDVDDSPEKVRVKEEIVMNLTEMVEDIMASGKQEEDAINSAIVEFGELDELKKELTDKKSKAALRKAWLRLMYSVWSAALLTALFLFINFYYSPRTIWFVFPVAAVLIWPLTMLYVWLGKR